MKEMVNMLLTDRVLRKNDVTTFLHRKKIIKQKNLILCRLLIKIFSYLTISICINNLLLHRGESLLNIPVWS